MMHVRHDDGTEALKWAPQDIQNMIEFQHAFDRELEDSGEMVFNAGLSWPDQARIVRYDGDTPAVPTGRSPRPRSSSSASGSSTATARSGRTPSPRRPRPHPAPAGRRRASRSRYARSRAAAGGRLTGDARAARGPAARPPAAASASGRGGSASMRKGVAVQSSAVGARASFGVVGGQDLDRAHPPL